MTALSSAEQSRARNIVERAAADASLIAAAPDMLAALKLLANVTPSDNSPIRIRAIAYAAIAKAEGRP